MTPSSASPPRHPRQWEIWQVRWRHEDGTSKGRPALVVSSDAHNARGGDVWCLKISGEAHAVRYRVDLETSDPEFPLTGLTKDSYFYLTNIQRIPPSGIIRHRGVLGRMTGQVIDALIRVLTSTPPP